MTPTDRLENKTPILMNCRGSCHCTPSSYLFFSLLVGLPAAAAAAGDEVDDNEAVGMISALNLELSTVDPGKRKANVGV